MRTIPDETALPGRPAIEHGEVETYFIRCKADQYVLIGGHTGDVFARKDGAVWEWPAYKVFTKQDGTTRVETHYAHHDSVRHRPASAVAA